MMVYDLGKSFFFGLEKLGQWTNSKERLLHYIGQNLNCYIAAPVRQNISTCAQIVCTTISWQTGCIQSLWKDSFSMPDCSWGVPTKWVTKDWQVTGEEDEDIHFIYRYCDGTAQPVDEEYRCWFPNFTKQTPSIQQHTAVVARYMFIRTIRAWQKYV